jgi:hypothetical protein
MGMVKSLGFLHGSSPQKPRFRKNHRASSTRRRRIKKERRKHSVEPFHGKKTKEKCRIMRIKAHKER